MGGLSPALEQLVEAGKLTGRPTEADSARVLNAIQGRLALVSAVAGAEPGSADMINSAQILTLRAVVVSSMGAVLIVAGVALLRWLVPGGTSGVDAVSALSVASASGESVVSVEGGPSQPQGTSPSVADVGPSESSAGSGAIPVVPRGASKTHDSLAEEVDTLSRAERELYGGRPESALVLLNEHERKFRNGTLAEERTAARIQALCLLGREAEASALYKKLSPSSLHGKSTRRACAIPKSK